MTVSARWGLIGSVAAITGAVAATAVFGDDIERALDSMGDIKSDFKIDNPANGWGQEIAYYVGNFVGWLGDMSAKGLSLVTNLFSGISSPQDFQTAIGGDVYNDLGQNHAYSGHTPVNPLTSHTAESLAQANATRITEASQGIGGVAKESWERIANSATGEYISDHPWQATAAAGTVVVGAHALGKVADRAEVEIAKNQQQQGPGY